MIRRISFAWLTLLLFVLASCSKGEVYCRFHHIHHGKWHRDSSLLFVIDPVVIQSGNQYSLSIELSSNNAYPYQDLWLRVEHNLTDPLFRSDTLHVLIADERGKWLGRGVGGLLQLSIPYLDAILPAACDSMTGFQVKMKHYMDDDPLTGVEKVGVRIVE